MNYDVNYFIKKFEAIPEDEWCVGHFINPDNQKQRCVIGHCGGSEKCTTIEEMSLSKLLGRGETFDINDDNNPNYHQPTPKQRILAALYDIKNKTN